MKSSSNKTPGFSETPVIPIRDKASAYSGLRYQAAKESVGFSHKL
jgi:hypothetical protein